MADKDISSKRPQKKSKSQWRKNIDISVVDENLQTRRNEERILGKMDEQAVQELFFVDKKGDEQVQRHIKKLRIEEILIPKSKIDVQKTRQGPTAKKPTSSTVDPAVKKLLATKRLAPVSVSKATDKSLELWPANDESPRRSIKKTAPSLLHPSSKLKAFDTVHSGSSYNPSYEEHQNALAKAVKLEEQREALEKIPVSFLKALSTPCLPLASPVSEPEESIESNPTSDLSVKIKPTKPKTKSQRKKAIRLNQETAVLKRERTLKRLLNEVGRLRSIKKEIKTAQEQEQLDQLERAYKKAQKDAYQTKRLSKKKFEPPMFPVQLTEDLASNLRTIKSDTNLLADRFKRLQEKNLIEVREPAKRKRQLKKKTFERHSYKDFK